MQMTTLLRATVLTATDTNTGTETDILWLVQAVMKYLYYVLSNTAAVSIA